MQENQRTGPGLMLMVGVAALFLAGFFLLVVFGAQSYRGTVDARSGNMDNRALLAYLSTIAKANDTENAFSLRRDPVMGDVLVIADGESGYATHLYRADGALMEDYCRIGAELSPERSQRIAETGRFEIMAGDGLITVVTDAGRVLIHLRSGEAAA